MRDAIFGSERGRAVCAAVILALALSGAGCELTGQGEPQLSGPSDQGFNVELLALPDVLNADGISQCRVRLVLRNENGEAVSGYAVLFEHDGDGILDPDPSSTYVGPIQTGEVMATDSSGIVFVIYTAGTSFRTVTVTVRPSGFDVARFNPRSVFILQR